MNGGEDCEAKWDVFAECLIRLPSASLSEDPIAVGGDPMACNRFVDYSRVECERFTDLADETDTLNQPDGANSG
jgi:hypothetical protein